MDRLASSTLPTAPATSSSSSSSVLKEWPVEFYTHGRELVQELARVKVNDHLLLPPYFTKSKFRSLTPLHQSRCIDAWKSLSEEKRKEIKEKLKIPESNGAVVPLPPSPFGPTMTSVTQPSHQLATTTNSSSSSSSNVPSHAISGSSFPQLIVPPDLALHSRAIIKDLVSTNHLPVSYARRTFEALKEKQKRKVLYVYTKVLSPLQRNALKERIGLIPRSTASSTLPTSASAVASASTLGKRPSANDDSSEDGRPGRRKSPDRPVTTIGGQSTSQQLAVNNSISKDDELARKLNIAPPLLSSYHSSSTPSFHWPSSTLPANSHTVTEPISVVKEILLQEDSEVDFALKILSCPTLPDDLKDSAVKQLREIQKKKIERRSHNLL
jgi:hypothetical protein